MNVTQFPRAPDAKEMLKQAKEANLSTCIVIGETEDEDLWIGTGTNGDLTLAFYFLAIAQAMLVQAATTGEQMH